MRLWGSAGKAADVLDTSEPWAPIEHLIIYNVKGVDEQAVRAMMTEGRRVLAAIPGVREVIAGEAVKAGAAYPYTWLVRFCHPAVIYSYRNHPSHVAFAHQLFRPVAGERISIDYQIIESSPNRFIVRPSFMKRVLLFTSLPAVLRCCRSYRTAYWYGASRLI